MKYKEKPLADITLRKYEKPYQLTGRDLAKKVCLSLGLLQPGDSRDVMVDVFHSIILAEKPLSSVEIEKRAKKSRKENKLPMTGITPPNIRRQIKRLKDALLVERVGHNYRLAEGERLHTIFAERIEKLYLPAILSRVREYCEAIEKDCEIKKNERRGDD